MKVQMRDIKTITPYAGNPRRNDGAVDAVARSIKEFGWRQPIVVDGQGVIVVGHTRYKAALELGLAKVPVHVATDLSEAQARAYRLADNSTGAIAEWDEELLTEEIAALEALDFDLGGMGLDQHLDVSAGAAGEEDEDEDEDAGRVLEEVYQVVASCASEAEQRRCVELLEREGYQCRVLTL